MLYVLIHLLLCVFLGNFAVAKPGKGTPFCIHLYSVPCGRHTVISTHNLKTTNNMSKVNVPAIAEDERDNNVKKSAARRSASDAQAAAQKMEGETAKVKSIAAHIRDRAEESAQAAIVPDFAAYVIKYTFAELKKEYRKCYTPIEDGDNTDGLTIESGGIRKFYEKKGRGCKYFRYFRLIDTSRLREVRKVLERLRYGCQITENFTLIPRTKNGELYYDNVRDLHTAFSSMFQSYLPLYLERKKQAEKEQAEQAEQAAKLAAMAAKVQAILAKVQEGTATQEEMTACILAQAEMMKLQK